MLLTLFDFLLSRLHLTFKLCSAFELKKKSPYDHSLIAERLTKRHREGRNKGKNSSDGSVFPSLSSLISEETSKIKLQTVIQLGGKFVVK